MKLILVGVWLETGVLPWDMPDGSAVKKQVAKQAGKDAVILSQLWVRWGLWEPSL